MGTPDLPPWAACAGHGHSVRARLHHRWICVTPLANRKKVRRSWAAAIIGGWNLPVASARVGAQTGMRGRETKVGNVMTPGYKRIVERLLVVGILSLVGVIGWRLVGHRSMTGTGMEVIHLANVRNARVTVPGCPHFQPGFTSDPESVQRRVTYTLSTNSHALRDDEFPLEKAPGEIRIAAVGECVTFGNGVNNDQTWPALLEADLREAYPDRRIEVINAGKPGPPGSVLDRLREDIPQFSPDVVLFSPGAESPFAPDHVNIESYRLHLEPQEYDRLLSDFDALLEEALQLSRKHGFQLVLVTPTINSFFLPDGKLWVDALRNFGAEHDLPVLDTTRIFQKMERREGLVFEKEGQQQSVVAVRDGEPTTLFQVTYDGERHISPEIYAWLDDHPRVSPLLSIDENHPNPRGHRVISTAALRLLQREISMLQGPSSP